MTRWGGLLLRADSGFAGMAACAFGAAAAVRSQALMRLGVGAAARPGWAAGGVPRCRRGAPLASRPRPRSVTGISASAAADGDAVEVAPPEFIGKIELKVGRIVAVEKHPEADSLYVEQIDVGESEGPRTIVSGLVPFIPEEDLLGAGVVIVANLKPRNMRGVKSAGMVLCASNADHTQVELVRPPEGAAPGERIELPGFASEEPATGNVVGKKKMWEAVSEGLRTTPDRVAAYKGAPFTTSAGVCSVDSLAGSHIG